MIPLIIGAIAAALPSIISAIGQASAAGDKEKAEALRQQAIDRFGAANIPPMQQIVAMHQQQTGLANMQTDPRMRQAEVAALGELSARGNAGGLRPQDVAKYNQMNTQLSQAERGNREALQQNAQMRGVGGSGLEYANALANQQGAASRASQQGYDLAGHADDAALQSLMAAGQMGSSIRGQDYGEASSAANAQDNINRFNQMSQRQADEYDVNQGQQYFNNQMTQASGLSGQYQNAAGAYDRNAAATQDMWNGLGQAAGSAAGAYGQYEIDKQKKGG
jgi:hypothetical protein